MVAQKLEEIKHQLLSGNEQQKIVALSEILQHGEQGLELLIQQSINDSSEKIKQVSYWVLHNYNTYLSDQIHTICPTDAITSLALSPNNTKIVGGSWKRIYVWDLQTGNTCYRLEGIQGHSHWVLTIAISPDGTKLVSGSADKTIKIWDLKTGQLITTLKEKGHSSWITFVTITPNGEKIISGSADKTIKIWDIKTGKLIKTLKDKSMGIVLCLAISSDGKVMASGGTDNKIYLWNLEKENLIGNIDGHSNWIQSLAWNSQTLISGSRDGEVKFWKFGDKKEQNNQNLVGKGLLDLGSAALFFVSGLISVATLVAGAILYKWWSENSGKDALIYQKPSNFAKQIFNQNINFIQLNRSNNLLIFGGDSSKVMLMNININQIKYTRYVGLNFVSFAIITSDGKRFISAGNDWIMMWDIETGNSLYSFQGCSYSKLSKISIYNPPQQVLCGETHRFMVTVFDTNRNEFSLTNEKVIWKATGGQIDENGYFVAGHQEGTYTITVRVQSFEDSISLKIIEPPRINKIIIEPSNPFLYCGQFQKFTVRVLDQRNVLMPQEQVKWTINGGGKISNDGDFKAGQQAGTFQLTMSTSSYSESIWITIRETPKLDHLILTKETSKLETNQEFTFAVQGIDQYGNYIQTGEINWFASSGRINKYGKYYGTEKQETVIIKAVVKQQPDIFIQREINVIKPPRLDRLEIYPSSVILEPRQEQDFTVIGYDQYDAEFPVSYSDISWTLTEGNINSLGHYSTHKTQEGNCYVSATVNNIQVTAHIFVVKTLKYIAISCKQVELYPEESYQFNVQAFDQNKHLLTLNHVQWKTNTGGTINRDGLFIGGYNQRQVTVTATGVFTTETGRKIEKKATATVILLPVVRYLEIVPNFVFMNSNSQQQFIVKGFDQFGEEIDIDSDDIEWSSNRGKIDQEGLFSTKDNIQGYCQIKASSKFIPKHTRQSRTFLLYIGVASHLLSWFIKDKLVILLSDIFSYLLESENEAKEINIEQQGDQGVLDLKTAFSDLGFNLIFSELIYRILRYIGNFCINESMAFLSATAVIFVLETQGKSNEFLEDPDKPDSCSNEFLEDPDKPDFWEKTEKEQGDEIEDDDSLISFPHCPAISYDRFYTLSYESPYKSNWFYRSQLFYDGYCQGEMSYVEYLEYVDQISFMERLI